MLPRVAFVLGFLATMFGTYAVLDRRDRPAGAPFSFTPPKDFYDTMPGVWFHAELEGGEEYREIMSLDEGEGAFFPGEQTRRALYGKGKALVGDDVEMKVVESSVTTVGEAPVVFARLAGKDKDGVEIHVYTWHFATDRGVATLRGFCLPEESDKYRVQYEAAAKSAKGVAVRVARPEWYVVSGAGLGVGGLLWFLASRRYRKPPPPKAPAPPVDDDDDDDDEALPDAEPAPKATS